MAERLADISAASAAISFRHALRHYMSFQLALLASLFRQAFAAEGHAFVATLHAISHARSWLPRYAIRDFIFDFRFAASHD